MSQFPEIGRYQILRRLAVGGMGEVFLARQRSSVEGFVRLFAIKVLLQSYSTNSAFVSMFLDEARTAAKLHHKNIVQVVDIDRYEDQYYIVMEYIPGQNLRELLGDASITGRSLFDPRLGAETFAEIASALEAVHAAGLIHRDVSPNNIMLSDTGVPKLIDFGVARATSTASLTTPGTLKGKFGYMAPEYVRGQEYDHRADVFSLGIVMWETFCRKRLFRGTSAAEQLHQLLEAEILPVHQVVPGFPEELSEVIAIALSRDPTQRFPTAAALASAITQVAINLAPSPEKTLAAWLESRVGSRMAERKRTDEAFLSMPSDAEIPAFDEAPGTGGSIPGTYGLYQTGGSGSHSGAQRGIPTGRPSAPYMSNQFAAASDANSGTSSVRRGVGEIQQPMVPEKKRGGLFVMGGIGLAAVAGVLLWTQMKEKPAPAPAPAPAAATEAKTAPSQDIELAEAHRRIGLKALADKEFGKARQEFTEAMRRGGASADLSELLKLATELEDNAKKPAASETPQVAAATPATNGSGEQAGSAAETPKEPDKKDEPSNRRIVRRDPPPRNPRNNERGRSHAVAASEKPDPETAKPEPVEEKPATGDLIVTSTPPKLPVRVDGKVIGQTPLRVPQSVGLHHVAIMQGDRVVYAETVAVREKDQAFVHGDAPVAAPAPTPPPVVAAPTPKPQPAPVVKTPAPVKAATPTEVGELEVISPNVVGEVFVNGVSRGFPPIVVKGIPVGKATIEIRVDGKAARNKKVNVTSGSRTKVRFN